MKWSKYWLPTLKEAPQEAQTISHKLMLRAGLVRMLISGVYLYLPLGLRVLRNIEKIIRQEMDNAGASEVLLSALQPIELWQQTNRDELIGDVMIRFTDRRGRRLSLGPTHEEIITFLVKQDLRSYRDLPIILYQIQTKFRDELRPRFGLIRCCEFIMKDAYSFDVDEAGLDRSYSAMFDAYNRIFKRMGLRFAAIKAETGVMGGSESAEFLTPAPCGEDTMLFCKDCQRYSGLESENDHQQIDLQCPYCGSKELEKIPAIEVGHIFKLGTKYSRALELYYLSKDGELNPVVMGCYGIGVSRLISAIIEQHNDEKGIIWPKEVSPFDVLIVSVNPSDKDVTEVSEKIYTELQHQGVQVLWDERDIRAGVKFNDADLVGIPLQIIIGKNASKGKIELKHRRSAKIVELSVGDVTRAKLEEFYDSES